MWRQHLALMAKPPLAAWRAETAGAIENKHGGASPAAAWRQRKALATQQQQQRQ